MKHIFISYCRKDKEWKNLLVKHLQAAGLDKHVTLWDDSKIEYGSQWRPVIHNTLKKTSIAIFLITVDFLNSKFIKSVEVPTLLNRRKKEGITIIPVLVKSCAWKAVKWLNSIQSYPRDSKCLSELSIKKRDKLLADFALHIKEFLEKPEDKKKKYSKTIQKKNKPKLKILITPHSIDHKGPVMFVGREKELAQIEECIPNKDKKELSSGTIQTITGRLFNIDGAGGIGKTTLAIEVARKFGHRFKDGVLPPFRADELSPTAFAVELAGRLNVPVNEPPDKERARELITALLKERQLLLVLDNVLKWSDLTHMLPRETPSMILITTRDRDIYHHLRMNCRAFHVTDIALERFSPEEALRLFRSMLDKDYRTADEPIYDQIASSLGYLPIALRQSISLMIYAPRYSPSQLLERLSKEDRLELLRKGNAVESSDSRTIEAVFDLSSSLLTPPLNQALQYLSVCSPGPVTCGFLQALTSDKEIAGRLEQLFTYSWVERRGNQDACTYELHQLVRELIKRRFNNPFTLEMIQCVHHMFTDESIHFRIKEENFFQLEEAFRLACETADERLKEWLYDSFDFCKFRGYGEFYIRLTQAVERLFPGDKWAMRTIYNKRAFFEKQWGNLDEAMALHKKEEVICEELSDQAGLSQSYGDQALLLKAWGKLDQAMDYLKKQEVICEKSSDRTGLSRSYCNQALILKAWGELDKAMALHKKEEKIKEELGDHAGLSRSYCNQALILQTWGKLNEAMALHKKEEKIKEELGDRAGLSRSYGNQALILKVWGKLDEAMAFHKKEEAICEELGDRAGLSACYGNQALILKAWGKLDVAIALHKKQEEICNELGDRDGLSKSYCAQGLILKAWGKNEEAMELYKKEEEICEELGDRAGLSRTYGNQALILKDWGKLDEAMDYLKKQEAICEELGNRAGLATCYGNQALILKTWGKLDEAMALHKEEEAICEELGDRAGLSGSYGNQAMILKDWGKLDEAMDYLKKQESICEELGDRAQLSRSYGNQAIILQARGGLDEAMDYLKKQESICEELGDRAGLARTWWNQGLIYAKQGDTAKQIELWKKSIETFKSMNMPTEKLEAELEELVKGC